MGLNIAVLYIYLGILRTCSWRKLLCSTEPEGSLRGKLGMTRRVSGGTLLNGM